MFDPESDNPLPFPANRECLLSSLPSTLQDCWERSRVSLNRVQQILSSETLPDEVVTVYVCGSMGRMEQIPSSDCDLIIVTVDDVPPGSKRGQEIHADLWSRLEPLGLIRPKPNGIFSETVTWWQLINPETRGQVDEDQFIYGKRIQLLLDSQPVFNETAFRELVHDVLQRFQRVDDSPEEQWVGLLNEVIRYWKALGTRTLWLDDVSPGTWRYLNIKFKHSRNLLIFGLLILLGEASVVTENSRGWLAARLSLTPLERVAALSRHSTGEPLLVSYAVFLQQMGDPRIVDSLKFEQHSNKETPEYESLMKNGTQFVTSLTKILNLSADNWPSAIRRELLIGP